jgi:hypothetical protein
MANESFENVCAPTEQAKPADGASLNLNSLTTGGCTSPVLDRQSCQDTAPPPAPASIEINDIYQQCCKCPDQRTRPDAPPPPQSERRDAHDNYGDYGDPKNSKRKPGERYDVTISNGGRRDVVTAVMPAPNDTLATMLQKMHTNPSLSERQLKDEVQALLKYNKAYGNDLGDGTKLGDKPVYLTSVKFRDAQGHITKIAGPTGRVTEFEYQDNNVVGVKIADPNGQLVEDLKKDATGWKSADGSRSVKNVAVDGNGNVTVEQNNGDKIARLTRGDDVLTKHIDGRPMTATTSRNGVETVSYRFAYQPNGEAIALAKFDRAAQEIELDEQQANLWLQRIKAAGINQRFAKRQGA